MMASEPSSAPLVPPETGASTQRMPLAAARRAAMSRVAAGVMDEKSTTTLPWPGTDASPFAPNATSSTAAASVRHMKMMSASRATSAGLAATRAPAARAGSALAAERFQTARPQPAARNRSDMGKPIRPMPRYPNRAVLIVLPFSRISWRFRRSGSPVRATARRRHG